MRRTNEEFAAEVMRRSAEYRRRRISVIRICASAAACLLLTVGGTAFMAIRIRSKSASCVSSAAPPKDEESKATVSTAEPPALPALRIETEQSSYPAGTAEIPVTVTNQSDEPVSVHPYEFHAAQGGNSLFVHIDLPEEALRRMTVTVQPGTSETLMFPAAEYLHDLTGRFTLYLHDAETEFDYGN